MMSLIRCRQHRDNNHHRRPSLHNWSMTSRFTSRRPCKISNWAGLGTVRMKTSGYQNQYIAVPEKTSTRTPKVKTVTEEATPANPTLRAIITVKTTDQRTRELLRPDCRNRMINLTGDNGEQSFRRPMGLTPKAPPAATRDRTDNPDTSRGNETDRKKRHTSPATSERNKQGK